MPDKHPTICAKCEYHMPSDPGSALPDWCKVKPEIDYVTGSLRHLACWRKNHDGTCADYAPAPVPPDDQADEAMGSHESDEQGVTGDENLS